MSFDLYNYRAICVGVYDGDSITLDIDLGYNIWMRNQKIRMLGINTPEIRGEERPDGLAARDYLRDLILDKEVMLKSYKDRSGKYGRWLGTILTKDEDGYWLNVNQHLLAEGHAKVYYP